MNKAVNALSYTGILFFLPLVVTPESKEGKFHANQGLLTLILSLVLHVAGNILGALTGLPFIGFLIGIIGSIFGWTAWAIEVAILIFGIVNSINEKTIEIPLIGKINLINK